MLILKDVGDVLSVCIFGGTAKGKLLTCGTRTAMQQPYPGLQCCGWPLTAMFTQAEIVACRYHVASSITQFQPALSASCCCCTVVGYPANCAVAALSWAVTAEASPGTTTYITLS
jgi:hypothetical protein